MDGTVESGQSCKRYLRPDGSVQEALRSTTVLRDSDGRPVGVFAQVLDMTDVAEAEAARERSESRLRAMLARSSELCLLLDRRGRIRYASPASAKILGYLPEALEGR